MEQSIRVIVEEGQRKTFAYALDWPGWSRYAADETAALARLVEYGPRYAAVLEKTGIDFEAPVEADSFEILERAEGNSTTDYGAPDLMVQADFLPVSAEEHEQFVRTLRACWRAFDNAVTAAEGKALATGPRGGGRDLQKMIGHVIEADGSYLQRIGWRAKQVDGLAEQSELARVRAAILDGLAAKIMGDLPDEGPRGGKRWPARYFVRRVAWHVLDHAWEIEDRIQ